MIDKFKFKKYWREKFKKHWRKILLVSIIALCLSYAYTGFSYYERCILTKLKEMTLVVYLAILSRVVLVFALFLIFINYELIPIIKKKWPGMIFLIFLFSIIVSCVIYIIYQSWENHIFGSPQNLSEIIHNEILSPIVIFLYSLIFLCVVYFRIAFHYFGSFENVKKVSRSYDIIGAFENYLSDIILARYVARNFVISSIFFSIWGSIFLFFIIHAGLLDLSQIWLWDNFKKTIIPAIFAFVPFIYVSINLYFSANEFDEMHFIKLKISKFISSDFSNVEFISRIELKPDFVDYLYLPILVNLITAYLPLFLRFLSNS